MTGRERDKFRKYDSGNVKREKKRKAEELMQKHRGSMHKFLTLSRNEDIEITVDPIQSSSLHLDNTPPIIDIDKNSTENNILENNNKLIGNNFIDNDDSLKNESHIWSDPGNWPSNIDSQIRYDIIKLGPIRVMDYEFPTTLQDDDSKRKFNKNLYKRNLINGEKTDRVWLVYSITKNCVFCYSCKLFSYENPHLNHLSTIGTNDWKHVPEKLITHERSVQHFKSIEAWTELKKRILKEKSVNQQHLSIIEKEKIHWKNVLNRILSVIHYLAAHNDAFRGSSDVLYTKSNGKFLGLIEMLAKFDPVIKEHVNRIQNNETHVHYLGHRIQDEIINMMANEIKQKIIKNIQSAKYFTVIMDCTPDIGHSEQLAILLRIVHMDEENEYSAPTIQEYFLDFVTVDSTTGLNLSEVLITQLKLYKINIENCRGQAYDNGSNMTGKYQGVQTRISNINPRAFFTPCAAHNLNLVLCDAAKNSTIAITFFGIVRRVYTLFSASTYRWSIIKKHCTVFTVKQWSETRWESRINSIKALRFQLSSILNALEEVSETANDLMAQSEAVSLSNEIGNYEFILSLVIWYDILTEVNIVSKSVQDHNMDINTSVKLVQSLIQFLHQFRKDGFNLAKIAAKKLAEDADITVAFKNPRVRKKTKLFDYENVDEPVLNNEDRFRTNYFFIVLDHAIQSIEKRFNQLETYSDNFGFLHRIDKLKTMENDDILKHCKDLQIILTDNDLKDIDGLDLFSELIIFRSLVVENTNSLQALNILKTSHGSFPNLTIALRIMLTIPVTSACAERSFSKLKLIKTYLRNRLGQDKLSELALISIEEEVSSTIDYKHLIDIFASKKSRKKIFS